MGDIVLYEKKLKEIEKIIEEGRKLYDRNEFYRDLANLMESPEGKNFVEKYFKSGSDTKTAMMFIKTYELLKDKYEEVHNSELNKFITIYMLKEAISHGEFRHQMVTKTLGFFEDKSFEAPPEIKKIEYHITE